MFEIFNETGKRHFVSDVHCMSAAHENIIIGHQPTGTHEINNWLAPLMVPSPATDDCQTPLIMMRQTRLQMKHNKSSLNEI